MRAGFGGGTTCFLFLALFLTALNVCPRPLPAADEDSIALTLGVGDDGSRRVTVRVPPGCTDRLDILAASNISDGVWVPVAEGLTACTGSVVWADLSACQHMFYVAVVAETNAVTDPDCDGVPWGREVFLHGTDPGNADSDGDRMPDGWEIRWGLCPTLHDAAGDQDGDGWSNVEECFRGGRPNVPTVRDSGDLLQLRLLAPSG
jgi:hypothetical protein